MPTQALNSQYQLYNDATRRQTGDYSSIMDAYRQMFQGAGSRGTQGQITPSFIPKPGQFNYQETAGYRDSAAKLKELSETGGYDAAGIADLRARGTSPIRSIYAGANREMGRQSALSGGNAVNTNALRSKNAREMSELVSGATQNVNAGIAQNVAANKLSAAPQYADLVSRESALRNQYGKANQDEINRVNEANTGIGNRAMEFNSGVGRGNQDDMFKALEGMRGLFGTTPAMSALYGNQAQNAFGQASQNRNSDNNNVMEMIRQLMQRRN